MKRISPIIHVVTTLVVLTLACGATAAPTVTESGAPSYSFSAFGKDYGKLLAVFPADTRELGMIWAYTGLERSDGCPKRGLAVWDGYLGLPVQK